jgi:single-strand DNA-binding protein
MKANGLARIGRDVELRHTPNGEAVANLSLAFTYGKRGADGKRPTQWVEAALWGKRAESLAPYLLKGQQVVAYLEDVSIQTFRKQDGTDGVKLAARVGDLELIAGQGEAQQQAPAPTRAPAPRPAAPSGFDDMDDGDIPF